MPSNTAAGLDRPLGWIEKLGFASGDLGATLFFQLALLYLLYFYTDVAGIPPAWAAAIFIVARFVDAAANPIIGMAADRTRTRWGRYRPYIAWGAIPLAALSFATFTVVDLPLAYRIAYALITYSLFSLSFAAVAIPYSALMAVMTHVPGERALLGILRAGFGFTAGVVVSVTVLPIVHLAGTPATGFHLAILVLALIGIPLLLVTASTARERVYAPAARRIAAREMLSVILTKPLVTLTATFMVVNVSALLRSASVLYYFKYNLGSEANAAAFFTVGSVATIVAIATTALLARHFDKRTILIASMVLASGSHLAAYFLPGRLDVTFMCLGILPSFAMGLGAGVLWSSLSDSVDYAEWRTGLRAEGVCFGIAILGQKVSFALGGALTGWTLSYVGYQAGKAQTPSALAGIHELVSLFPGLLSLVGVAASIAYPLSERAIAGFRESVAERQHTSISS